MKTIKLVVALMLVLTPTLVHADILAGPVTNTANGHVYYLLTQNTWVASEAEAVALGGHLATINDASEQTWVFGTFGTLGGTPRSLWIGLTDRISEGNFVWINGEGATYRNWAPGEPNNANNNEHFGYILDAANPQAGKWNDFPNDLGPAHGIVETDLIHVQIQVASVSIRWNSHSNTLYQVQYATSLPPTNWLNLGGPVPGSGTNNVAFDSTLDEPRRFYRVIALP